MTINVYNLVADQFGAGLPESNQTIGIGYVNGTDSSEGYFLGEVQNNEGTFEFKYYPEKLLTTDASLSSDELTLLESLAAGTIRPTIEGSVSFTPLPSYSGNIEVSTYPFHNTYLLSDEEAANFDPNNLTIENGTFVDLVSQTYLRQGHQAVAI